MCGIAGYFGSGVLHQERIDECLQLMKRRGPDATGFFHTQTPNAQKQVYLLHSRLSIIDLAERANQPFVRENLVTAFNGEIYNYLELKKDLEKRGIRFSSSSDTEVLLALLQESGTKSLERCEGMWSFATYDKNSGDLLLSRDRFGEKPLYIYRDNTGIYFGSEPKFIMALLGKSLEINHNQVRRFLINGYKSLYKKEETFFSGLTELKSGHSLKLTQAGSQTLERYWIPKININQSLTYADAVEQARELLFKAVKLRLRADVPLAFCMSGGIDSNTVISIAKKICNYDVHGFTIVNTDSRYEEQEMVDHAVAELGIRHTPVSLTTTGFLDNLRELVRYHDAPVLTISSYAQWMLMKNIHQAGYKISLSGVAADEMLAGYYDHQLLYLHAIKDIKELHPVSRENWIKHISPIVRNPFLQHPDVFIQNPEMRDHIYLDSKEFAQYLKPHWFEPFEEKQYSNSLLRNRMLNETFEETVPVLLHEEDLNAMYYSIENRAPFLDRDFFEFCYSIPAQHLIHDGRNKAILRDAMRGVVPDKILNSRRKVGFNAPIHDLLDTNSSHVRDFLFEDSPIFSVLDREKIKYLYSKPKSQIKESENKFLFYFVSSKMFLEEFSK